MSISILQKPALLVPELYKFDDGVLSLVTQTRIFFFNGIILWLWLNSTVWTKHH